MPSEPVGIGIIGCGNISGAYLVACRTFPILRVAGLADLDPKRAHAKAREHGVPAAESVEALLADPDVAIVVNLTVPGAHAEVSRAVLASGKSVYSEKPLATERADGAALIQLAESQGLRVGCAPDTFLGGGLQTCRRLIDDGAIGRPVAATGFMLGHGPETWHPDPAFFYERGAGPLFDMGPYYLTALVSLLGPIAHVAGSAVVGIPERIITSQPLAGTRIVPATPTHVTGLLDFESGVVATLTTSFEVWASEHPRLEIYGTEGTLSLPDPNSFGGPVRIRSAGDSTWEEVPLTHGPTTNSRGIGVADMAEAMATGAPHRASGEMAFHVLDVMATILEAAEAGTRLAVRSRCERPAPRPANRSHTTTADARGEGARSRG